MTLTKKHIGKLFDVSGGDGSWCYQLVDIKGKELLFYCFTRGEYEVDTNKYKDWRPFKPTNPWPKEWLKWGWERARRD